MPTAVLRSLTVAESATTTVTVELETIILTVIDIAVGVVTAATAASSLRVSIAIAADPPPDEATANPAVDIELHVNTTVDTTLAPSAPQHAVNNVRNREIVKSSA